MGIEARTLAVLERFADRSWRRGFTIIAIAATVSVVCGCQGPSLRTDPLTTEAGIRAAGGRLLAGPEAQAILGKPQRYRWTTASGASGYTQVSAGGRIRTYWDTDAVNGRIRFSETGYCTRYDGVRDNREDCYRLYRMAANDYRIFREDGTYSGTIIFER